MGNDANANPLDAGSDATTVESAATAFTEMLNSEAEPRKKSESSGKVRAEPSGQSDDDNAPDDGPEGDKGHAPEPVDEFLSGERDIPEDDGNDNANEDEDDEDANAETDNDDENVDDDNEDNDDDDLDLDREIEVNVAGETQKVKLAEVIAGYSREADYRQKTARLSEERDEVFAYAEEVVQERTHYAETLDTFVSMTEALQPSKEEWEALRKANPDLYIQTKEQWDQISAKVNEAKAEQAKIAEREAKDAVRQRNEFTRKENAKLLERIPALANPKKAKEFRSIIFKYGKDAGYTEQELLTGAVDHRDVITLYKAAKYDEIIRSRKAGQRPGKKEPKNIPSSRPRSLSKNAGKNRTAKNADARLARSGSVDDAAMAFTEFLRG